jgi:hypothetical protein
MALSSQAQYPLEERPGFFPMGDHQMPTAKKNPNFRWSTEIPIEETKPVGPEECFRSAIEKLGPFTHLRQADAEKFYPREGLGGKIALSKELAGERVWLLASNYNRQTRLDKGAPRTGDVAEALMKLEMLAGELARHMLSLDDIARQRLQTAGSGIADFAKFTSYPLMEEADAAGLPTPAGWDKQAEFRWVKRLDALSRYAAASCVVFLQSKGFDGKELPDKGGNTNLYKSLYGSARWGLVQGGWHIYELFKPGSSTGTEGGSFHLFLLDVFEYATGLDPEEDSKLMPWIKHVVKVNRRMEALTRQELQLIEEQCEIDSPDVKQSWEKREKRHAELQERMLAVYREKYDLWAELFPYSYPSRDR